MGRSERYLPKIQNKAKNSLRTVGRKDMPKMILQVHIWKHLRHYKKTKPGQECFLVAERLPSKCEALGSMSSTEKGGGGKKEKRRERGGKEKKKRDRR
jgi:hypothetical protein